MGDFARRFEKVSSVAVWAFDGWFLVGIEDILISLDTQYHLIRPLQDEPFIFVYLAVDRQHANLALCRRVMTLAEEKLKV